MIVQRIETLKDMELLRSVYNKCYKSMGRSMGHMSRKKMEYEWKTHERQDRQFLFFTDWAKLLGVGTYWFRPVKWMMKKEEDYEFGNEVCWVTVMVTPRFQNNGVGTYIFKYMRQFNPIYGEIRKKNLASFKAATKAGYRYIDENEKYIYVKGEKIIP